MLAFLGINLVGGLHGLARNYSLYYIVQHLSFPVYLVIVYFSTLVLIRDEPQIEVIIKLLLIGALLASLQQIFFFISQSMGYSSIFYRDYMEGLPQTSILFYRNAWIPYGSILPAMSILLSSMVVNPDFLGKRKSYLILLVYISALILTFTRGSWVAAIVYLLAFLAIARRPKSRRVSFLVGAICALVLLSILLLIVLDRLLPAPIDLTEEAVKRFSDLAALITIPRSLAQVDVGEPSPLGGRLPLARWSLKAFLEGNLLLGRGHGFLIVEYSGLALASMRAHNTFLFYLTRTGLIGLGTLLLILFVSIKRGLELGRNASSVLYRMTAMGLATAFLGLFVTGLGSGALSDIMGVSFYGVSFALIDVMAHRCSQEYG